MQGRDTPRLDSLALDVSLADRQNRPQPADLDDLVPCPWPLHTPPLRYDVASLEHWLDLNA
jgi:hypothetical protein